ncbi:MAG: hypothetical protein WD825_17130 [Gemmatimonadaceae bacterium]
MIARPTSPTWQEFDPASLTRGQVSLACAYMDGLRLEVSVWRTNGLKALVERPIEDQGWKTLGRRAWTATSESAQALAREWAEVVARSYTEYRK